MMPRTNGGVTCDMDDGPCACGAWHHPDDPEVQANPVTRPTPVSPDAFIRQWKELFTKTLNGLLADALQSPSSDLALVLFNVALAGAGNLELWERIADYVRDTAAYGSCRVCASEPNAGPGCDCHHSPCIHDRNGTIRELKEKVQELKTLMDKLAADQIANLDSKDPLKKACSRLRLSTLSGIFQSKSNVSVSREDLLTVLSAAEEYVKTHP